MGNFIGRLILPLSLVALIILTGCNLTSGSPTPPALAQVTPVPSLPGNYDCIVGEWELNDFADTITSMLPSDINFQYTGTNGRIHWTFAAAGLAEATADNFSLTFADKNDPSTVVTILTNGTARCFYTITGPNQITFSNPDDSEFTYSAVIDGVTVSLDPLLKGLVPVMPASGTITYQCQGLSLSIIPPVAGAAPEGFSKVRP